MKYTFIVIALFALFTACQKKSTHTACYACVQFDSTYSNIAGVGGTKTVAGGIENICDQSSGTIDFIERAHMYTDTSYHGHDTFIMHYHTYQCDEK